MTKFHHLKTAVSEECENACGLQILLKGTSIYEEYFNGHQATDRFHMTSVTKSVLSALVGIAIGKGLISSIDEPVSHFFPEYIPQIDQPFFSEVTLRHLLTMTAPFSFSGPMEPFEEICASGDWCLSTLSLLGHSAPPSPFCYSSFGAHLVSAILQKCTGMNARDFANKILFPKIGMAPIPVHSMESYDFDSLFGKNIRGWVSDPSGISTGGWGLTLTLQDMSAFGQLYLQDGMWKGESVIPSTWVHASLERNERGYGYYWWLLPDISGNAFAAMGDGGNIIYVIPEKSAVISMASTFSQNPTDRITFIRKHILPNL